MPQRVHEGVTLEKETEMPSHVRSSSLSRPPSTYIAEPISFVRAVNSANSANPVTQPWHLSESGRSSAKPFLLHRSHSTAARLPHAARPTVPDSSEIQSSRAQTSSPSPSISSSRSVATTLADSTASYATPPLGVSPVSSRSALARRPPASRSSHGIETSSGPPPALITRRSYTTEVARRRPAPAELVLSRPTLRGRSHTDSRLDSKAQRRNFSVDDFTRAGSWRSPSVKRRESENTTENMDSRTAAQPPPDDDDTDRTFRGWRGNDPSLTSSARGEPAATPQDERSGSLQEDEHSKTWQEDEHSKSVLDDEHSKSLQEDEPSKLAQEDEHSKSSQEDLFLDLAKSDTLGEDTTDVLSKSGSRSERRHSRASISTSQALNTPQPSASRLPSGGRQLQRHSISSNQESPHSQWSSSRHSQVHSVPSSIKNVPPVDRHYVSSSRPLDMGNDDHHLAYGGVGSSKTSHFRGGSKQETPPDGPAAYAYGGRQSIREPSPVVASRAYKQSNLSYAANGRDQPSYASRLPEFHLGSRRRLQPYQAGDAESSVSTTAPSTVWDTFDEIKHRIRNLSKIGASSGVGERPRTASTTTTTISTSPKYPTAVGASADTITTKGTQVHPLLRAALAKSKSMMDPKSYRALEAAASDALTLAALTGSEVGVESSHVSASHPGTGRQLRHKADSLCRSLTELCIALSDGRPSGANATMAGQVPRGDQSISLDQGVGSVQGPRYPRASSEDPEIRPSSRVDSRRMEARRRSMYVFSNIPNRQESSPLQVITPTQVATPPSSNRSDRTSILARRKARNEEEQSNDQHHYHDHRFNDQQHHYHDEQHYNDQHHPYDDQHHHYDDHQRYNDQRHSDHHYNNDYHNCPECHPNDRYYNEHRHSNHHHHYNDQHHHQVRPVSRAATEIGTHFRPSPLSRSPREYPPPQQQHPPPPPPPTTTTRHERSPSTQSSSHAWRRNNHHFPPSSSPPHSQPMSPTLVPGGSSSRRCPDCLPPPPTPTPTEMAHLAEVRQWRMTSLGISEDDPEEFGGGNDDA